MSFPLYQCSRVCRFSTRNLEVHLKHRQICDQPKSVSELSEAEKLQRDICPVCLNNFKTARELVIHVFQEHQVTQKEAKKDIEIIEVPDDEVTDESKELKNNNQKGTRKTREIARYKLKQYI